MSPGRSITVEMIGPSRRR